MNYYSERENINILLNEQLENLLSEELDSVIKREQESFDKLAEPFEKSIVLFGSGQLGRKTLAGLRKLGIEPLAFADNNPELWHKSIDNLLVLSPKEAADRFGDKAVFVVTIWRACSTHRLAQTREQLQGLNCLKVVSCAFLFWKYPETFLPHYCLDLPHKVFSETENIKKAFYILSDERSQYEYLAQLRWRILLDFDNLPSPIPQEQYFRQDIFTLSSDDVFVDCGSYDGDTIKKFLEYQNLFTGKIIALEPDQINFTKLEEYVHSLTSNIKERITLLPLAVGKQEERLRFAATGTASSVIKATGTIEVDCVTLDQLLSECIPTFIKMDIEGAELDAILGAKTLIEKHSPILAICVYHCQNHLWQIPLLIQSLSNQYRFFLSPHGEECWDLIFYAVPVSRLKILS
ncbi:MAG: FkbM family methyltransferase [Nostoc sp.]|uniref:FkbM family methyltransferase n=1 Tax=Nostoc sp. TaxID=1180 RepID=UPI002FFAC716